MFSIGYVLAFLILHQFPSFGYEYCAYEEELCKGAQHIVCTGPKKDSTDRNPIVPIITSRMRNGIVEQHNYYRNQVACGEVYDENDQPYPTAAKMHMLTWDFELEYLTRSMTADCMAGETFCQNSFRFRNVGQNQGVVDMGITKKDEMKPGIHLEDQIHSWFETHIILNNSHINSFGIEGFEYKDFFMYSQRTSFLLMVSDEVKQVGCTLSYCKQDNVWITQIVCNYSKDLVLGKPVYKAGKPASECETRSKEFPCLCEGKTKSINDFEYVLT